MKGECNCGAVSYESDGNVSDVFICHCSICRRTTGGVGIAVIIVASENFKWVSGKENICCWSKPGHDWHTYFCQVCGAPLPGDNDEKNMYIPVGSITSGGEDLKVAHHLYVNSKAPWEEIGDTGKQHPEAYETEGTL